MFRKDGAIQFGADFILQEPMHPYPTTDLVPNLAFAIMGEMAKMTTEQVPELKPDLPSFTKRNFKIGVDDTVCIATIEFKESGVPAGGGTQWMPLSSHN